MFDKEENAEKTKNVISEEVAEEQLDGFLEFYDIVKADIEHEDGPAAVGTLLNGIKRAIMRGDVEMEQGDGTMMVRQTLKFPTANHGKFEFQDKVQKAHIAKDKISDKRASERQFAFMACLSGVSESEFVKLKGSDASVFRRLAYLFIIA